VFSSLIQGMCVCVCVCVHVLVSVLVRVCAGVEEIACVVIMIAQRAWKCDSSLYVVGDGDNVIHTIHILDLISVVMFSLSS